MNTDNIYYKQVQLLVQLIPLIATENCFALKGGTAINLFVRNIPRLSVDIDLVYLPMHDRQQALKNIRDALSRISELILKVIPQAKVLNAHEHSDALRLIVQRQNVRVKIELSPVIRGTVFGERTMRVSSKVEETFGYAEIPIVSLPDLYAGKICAALDRQHPRDLFDVKFLFDNEGFTTDLRKTFLIYLISHQRPMVELLRPNIKNISSVYENEFVRMANVEVSLNELERTREHLIHIINQTMTPDEKKFLLSFKSKNPDWSLLGVENINEVSNLPSVRWKQENLHQMPEKKHSAAFAKLKEVLTL